MRLRKLALVFGWVAVAGAPALANAQDSDGDGVADAADAFPCDASRASVSYFPGATSSALLTYEDQWPSTTDLDFNDVVVRAHYRLERNAAGNVVSLHAVYDPVALGGELSNGLALQLPTSRAGVTARRRVAGGAWETLVLEGDTNATTILSPNLRELFGNNLGRINSLSGQAFVPGQRLELEVAFSPPAPLSVAAAPFDVFVFRAGDFAHQIHFPQYAGTAAMNTALFNSAQDASTPSRRFVHVSGVPAALNLMTTTRYPLEGVAISALFPDILSFAGSGGATHTNFYASSVVSSQGHSVAALALPAVPEADISCIPLAPVDFNFTGAPQVWTAPLTGQVRIEVWGAQGGGNNAGLGGYARGTLQVTAGTQLHIFVGERPEGRIGGYNGGGSSHVYNGSHGRGGGGGSDVRLGGTAISNRVLVAGGGGAGGGHIGGHGSGGLGGHGSCGPTYPDSYCGRGGTATAGGAGGIRYPCGSSNDPGQNGSLFYGGDGGRSSSIGWGDGGGGGWYGGGGAGGACTGSFSGGGGSGYIQSGLFTNTAASTGVRGGHGLVRISPL